MLNYRQTETEREIVNEIAPASIRQRHIRFFNSDPLKTNLGAYFFQSIAEIIYLKNNFEMKYLIIRSKTFVIVCLKES